MEKTILVTTKEYEKNPNTKTTYNLISTEVENITLNQHRMGTSDECSKFFKRLGGSFTRKFSYTSEGYKCTKVVSISPGKEIKSISEYKFL
jgi:hypothetical protein